MRLRYTLEFDVPEDVLSGYDGTYGEDAEEHFLSNDREFVAEDLQCFLEIDGATLTQEVL